MKVWSYSFSWPGAHSIHLGLLRAGIISECHHDNLGTWFINGNISLRITKVIIIHLSWENHQKYDPPKAYRLLESYIKVDFFRYPRCLEVSKTRSFRAFIVYSSQSPVPLPVHHGNQKTQDCWRYETQHGASLIWRTKTVLDAYKSFIILNSPIRLNNFSNSLFLFDRI